MTVTSDVIARTTHDEDHEGRFIEPPSPRLYIAAAPAGRPGRLLCGGPTDLPDCDSTAYTTTIVTEINTKNCSLSIVLTATDQKPQKSLKR